ncbi:MAG: hypothetical protein HYR96_04435 [Deltaproteobacteria bacterium]|nr:hypothetical protein [Deltaproteobacteria bacterium]MBI3296290.1 hypothetical protein [Deltaproteobacteria bacterium]
MKRLILILLLAHQAHGYLVRTQYEGIRPTGMGNAYLALADDSNSVWYNPAGLAKQKKWGMNLLDANGAWDSQDTLNRLKNALFNGDNANLLRPDTEMVRFGIFPKFFAPYFTFGLFEQINSFTDVGTVSTNDILNITAPSVDIFTFNDLGAIAGLGFPFGPYLNFGASVRFFSRTGINSSISPNDLLASLNLTDPTQFNSAVFTFLRNLLRTGYAIGLNVGFLGEVPLPRGYPKWTVAAAAEDVGVTTFRGLTAGILAPEPIISTYSAGTALQYTLTKHTVLNIALDLRNLLEDHPDFKLVHFGAEVRHKFFALRGGVSMGHLTYGASLEFPPHTRIHFSSYAIELANNLLERQQRYYMMQFIVGMNPF